MKTRYILLWSVLCLMMTGCLNLQPKEDPTRFYALTSKAMGSMNRNDPQFVIALARVTIPEYADRSQMVREVNPNELSYAEFHRWSEPLEKSITRVLAENLAKTVDGAFVRRPPWRSSLDHDYTVYIIINEFKARVPNSDVVLAGSYRVYSEVEGNDVERAQYEFTVPLPGSSCNFEDIASGMSDALAELGRRIARESFSKRS